jgi:hypothetical protein
MPIIAAASRSYDVARIALPTVVRATTKVRTTMSSAAPITVMSCGVPKYRFPALNVREPIRS